MSQTLTPQENFQQELNELIFLLEDAVNLDDIDAKKKSITYFSLRLMILCETNEYEITDICDLYKQVNSLIKNNFLD